jgi:hypothetical protein
VATVNNDHFSKTAEPEMPSEPHNKENCSVWLPTAPSESFGAYYVEDQNIAGRDILTDANREHGSSVMGSISEQRSTIPSTEYSCSKCGKKLKHACHLYSHYSIDHFRKEILAECAGFFKKVCPICGTSKACNTESKLAIHLGIRHRMVDLFLEPQFQVPRYLKHRKKYFEVRETVRENTSARSIHGPLIEKEKEKTDKERPGAVDFEDNAPLEVPFPYIKSEPCVDFPKEKTCDKLQADQFSPQQDHAGAAAYPPIGEQHRNIATQEEPVFCSICGKEERSCNALYRHYSVYHFAQQIADTCDGQVSGQCQLCRKFCKSEWSFLSHQA